MQSSDGKDETPAAAPYPGSLRDWAGNQAGGVRRLFDEASGRPMHEVLRTHLLRRLEAWAQGVALDPDNTPRVVLLVGGPGNGKTEAIESTVNWLDDALSSNGQLRGELGKQLTRAPVPRVATAEVSGGAARGAPFRISIVQDASIEENGQSRAQMLVGELELALGDASRRTIYLACVNRGVLDDAMIHVAENGSPQARALLQAVIHAAGLGGVSHSCWPLEGFPSVAVWPMDVESLLIHTRDGDPAPASRILSRAIAAENWPEYGTCPARLSCPFCTSRRLLQGPRGAAELMVILRRHELAAAKRWTFRDFFTLVSHLLAGADLKGPGASAATPCSWAASLAEMDAARVGQKPDPKRSSAIFVLVGSLYQHRLFGRWDARVAKRLREDVKDLALLDDHTAMGLVHFLRQEWGTRPPAMIQGLLESLGTTLDPAVADPGLAIALSGTTTIELRDIDARFSQSVKSGRDLMVRHKCLSALEMDLLGRLAELDRQLSTPAMRRRRPDAATRVQHVIRDFACRLVRRSLGTRDAVTRDKELLEQYQRIVEDSTPDGSLLLAAARAVSRLLNTGDKFEVSLTTTFGQPLPPAALRAVLFTAKQTVKPYAEVSSGRPLAPMRSLSVGRTRAQPLALTFDLYRSIRLLESGLSRASLPTEVNALIDATKARLSGPIVRDPDGLEDSTIDLGSSGAKIEIIGGRFHPIAGGQA